MIYAFLAAFKGESFRHISTYTADSFEIGFEILFLIEMSTRCFLEYTPVDSIIPVRDISSISVTYLKTQFVYDFIPLIPFQRIITFKYDRLLYLIKCMRLVKFFNILDINRFNKQVKQYYQQKMDILLSNQDG